MLMMHMVPEHFESWRKIDFAKLIEPDIPRVKFHCENKLARNTSERYWRRSRIISRQNAGGVSLKGHLLLLLFLRYEYDLMGSLTQ